MLLSYSTRNSNKPSPIDFTNVVGSLSIVLSIEKT